MTSSGDYEGRIGKGFEASGRKLFSDMLLTFACGVCATFLAEQPVIRHGYEQGTSSVQVWRVSAVPIHLDESKSKYQAPRH
jgi:hypothetical protein